MANVTYTVQNKSGSYDGDMVVKQYTSMTINSGDTVTVDQPCRGMFIYVQGDCTINGTLSMTAKGGFSDPTASGGSDSNAVGANGLRLGLVTSGGSSSLTNDGTEFNGSGTSVRTAIANQPNISSNGTIFAISKDGANGGASVSHGASGWGGQAGLVGSNGTTGAIEISTGGGGSGGVFGGASSGVATSGAGGKGGCFSAGASGGGATENGSNRTGGSGGNYGGAEGNGTHGGGGMSGPSSGRGNPTGGVGGLIWLVVGGNITIGASGVISALGTNGLNAPGTNGGAGGGASGGGAIMILHAGTYTNNGSVTAAGGSVTNLGGSSVAGGAGGAGGVHTAQVTF